MNNTIALVINAYHPVEEDIKNCIKNTNSFDEKIIYFNEETREFKDKNLPGFRVYGDGQNLSAADGFNFAIQQAKSEWICMFCVDDWFNKPIIEQLLSEIKENKYENYDLIRCPCFCGNDIMKWKIVNNDNLLSNQLKEKIQKNNCITFSSIYRKQIWKDVNGLHNEPLNDWGFWLRVLKKDYRIFNYQKPTYYWQIHKGQLFEQEIKMYGLENIRKQLLKTTGYYNE